jgi:hypothetical protein
VSPEAQRIAIAEACGWRFENYGTREFPNLYWRVFNPDGKLIEKDFTGADFRAVYVPDYLNDLNAMHEAEKTIRKPGLALWCDYARTLKRVCDVSLYSDIHATSAQRAEAYLRALNLWQESPPTTP